MPRHYIITLADALSAHERALSFGGLKGINDLGLIQSAISRPYSGYYRPIAQKASALVESIANNHGFADGNKRTAVYLMDLLIRRSGYTLTPTVPGNLPDEVEDMVLQTVLGNMSFTNRVRWFQIRLVKR